MATSSNLINKPSVQQYNSIIERYRKIIESNKNELDVLLNDKQYTEHNEKANIIVKCIIILEEIVKYFEDESRNNIQDVNQHEKNELYNSSSPFDKIKSIEKDVQEYFKQIANLSIISKSDKDYIILEEILTQNMLKLDTIDIPMNDHIRLERKKVIRDIQKHLDILEEKSS